MNLILGLGFPFFVAEAVYHYLTDDPLQEPNNEFSQETFSSPTNLEEESPTFHGTPAVFQTSFITTNSDEEEHKVPDGENLIRTESKTPTPYIPIFTKELITNAPLLRPIPKRGGNKVLGEIEAEIQFSLNNG